MTGINSDGAERRFHVKPLPPFAGATDALRDALASFAPVARLSVSDVAPRRMIEAGGHWVPWRPDVAPYMLEPMDVTTSRRFDSLCFVGPARSGKSDALLLCTVAHAVLAQPRTVAVFNASKDVAREWSEGQLSAMVEASPDLRARLDRRQGGDNMFSKRFRGGTRLTIDWPVKTRMMQRSIALVIATDYDAFPEDIEGDGEAFPLLRKRTESAGTRGMTIVESSPRFTIQDEAWTPQTAHEAPPCAGALGIYNRGSRGRLYWTCPDCSMRFEPRFDRLRYPDEGLPAERGAAAYMQCPDCGAVIPHRLKADLNRGAVWLHEEADGSAVPLADLKRPTATASYWLPAPAAALASWAKIVTRVLEAEEVFACTRDEAGLKTVYNVELGLPYLPRAGLDGVSMSEASLRAGASDHPWRVAPAGTLFLTTAVDVQSGRFVVQVEAWLPGSERVVIDRIDLFTPPPGAPGGARRMDPARFAEDWAALDALADAVYPVAGSDYGLCPVAVSVDAGGEPGVTRNAYTFWRRQRVARPNRFHLVRGRGGDKAKRIVVARPETAHQGKAHVAHDVILIWAGTDRLKDEVSAALLRPEPGPGKLHVSRYAPSEVFAEYAAERKTEKGWKKRPGVQRNEAFDLSVYNLATALAVGVEDLKPDALPAWARPGPDNLMARPIAGAAPGAPVPAAVAASRPRRRVHRQNGEGW